MNNDKCFECDSTEHIHQHHIIPESLGGKRTIPLCEKCHGKVHDRDFTTWRTLVTAGLKRARENGVKVGRKVGYRKPDDVFLHEDKIKKVIDLLNQGVSGRKISELTGVNKNTITKILKKMK